MSEVWTSRYTNYGGILESGLAPIRVTLGAPRFKLPYKLAGNIPQLAPTRATFTSPSHLFEGLYRAQLNELGVGAIRLLLDEAEAEAGRGLVLLCFEDVEKLGEHSCHRRQFAAWWREQTGEVIAELPTVKREEEAKPKAAQPALF